MKNLSKSEISIIAITLVSASFFYFDSKLLMPSIAHASTSTSTDTLVQNQLQSILQNPLSIVHMRNQNYPGSDLVIEKKLLPGINYDQYVASYTSDGYKIYGLLTIPQGT